MSAVEGEAAETAGKRTYAALTVGVRLTAAVPGTRAGTAASSQGTNPLAWEGASLEVVAFSVALVRV
jgi:hypothetical protein